MANCQKKMGTLTGLGSMVMLTGNITMLPRLKADGVLQA